MNTGQFPTRPILLVDDEELFLASTSRALRSEGINHVAQCGDSREVMSTLSKRDFSIAVLDLMMPHLSGKDLLPLILADFPDVPVTVVTGVKDVGTAVECLKTGAYDYLVKPVDVTEFAATIRRGLEMSELRRQTRLLKERVFSDALKQPEAFSDIITQDSGMHAIFQYTEAIAQTDLPVLITGETGVGKELIAAAIHKLSGREGEFVSVNIAGLDDHLFSDTLFGHKKGAYTGADKPRKGLIEQASNGTLFLDEIGDLHLESQVKLLRLLQERTYYPLGDDFPRTNNARIVVATNRDIQFLRVSETFRNDLYFRLQTHHIHLPPLRDRAGDIPLLVEHFLAHASETLGEDVRILAPELLTHLEAFDFPGNVRELEGFLLDAASQYKGGVLSIKSFQTKIGEMNRVPNRVNETVEAVIEEGLAALRILPPLKEFERFVIAEALKRANGNQTTAAQLLGMTRQALNKRLNRSKTSSDDA